MVPEYYPFTQEYLQHLLEMTEEKRKKLDEISTEYYLSRIAILLGRLVRIKRKQLGFRQLDLAVQIDVSPAYISELENGKIWNNINKLLELMQFLEINPINAFAIAEKNARSRTLTKYFDYYN